jgi:hypothetical protein
VGGRRLKRVAARRSRFFRAPRRRPSNRVVANLCAEVSRLQGENDARREMIREMKEGDKDGKDVQVIMPRFSSARIIRFPQVPARPLAVPDYLYYVRYWMVLPVALFLMIMDPEVGSTWEEWIRVSALCFVMLWAAVRTVQTVASHVREVTELTPGDVEVLDGFDGRNTTHQLQNLKIEPIVLQYVYIYKCWEVDFLPFRVPYFIIYPRYVRRRVNVHKYVNCLNASVRACTVDEKESVKRLAAFVASDNQVNYDCHDILYGENHLSDTQEVAAIVASSFYRCA